MFSVQSINWNWFTTVRRIRRSTCRRPTTGSSGGQASPCHSRRRIRRPAYQLIVTPATPAGPPTHLPHPPSLAPTAPADPAEYPLAADATLTDATVYTQGSESNPNYYTARRLRDVGFDRQKPDQPGSPSM